MSSTQQRPLQRLRSVKTDLIDLISILLQNYSHTDAIRAEMKQSTDAIIIYFQPAFTLYIRLRHSGHIVYDIILYRYNKRQKRYLDVDELTWAQTQDQKFVPNFHTFDTFEESVNFITKILINIKSAYDDRR
jgi:hypothetical protein